jgi:hypothetical protein
MNKPLATIPLADIIGFGGVTVYGPDGRVLRRSSVPELLARPRPTTREAPPTWRGERAYYADVPPVRRAQAKGGTQPRARARTSRGVVVA